MNNITKHTIKSILSADDLHEAVNTLRVLTADEKAFVLEEVLDRYLIEPTRSNLIVEELEKINFFEAPASTKYHGNFEGGLFIHSFCMFLALKKWTDAGLIAWNRTESPLIIGILHDLCKTDAYKPVFEEDNHSEETICVGYDYNENQFPLGHHALASLVIAQNITDLTAEEVLCIRWHMGAYEGQDTWNLFDKAIKLNENVLWTHTADMYASKVLEV